MILQSLHKLYDRLASEPEYEVVQPGFSPQKISFKVVLRPNGDLLDIQDARVKDSKGKLVPARITVPGEAKPPGAGINPCFLWDNQTYLLGRQPEDKADGFGIERFEAFKKRHLDLESGIDHPPFSAVCRFLENWSPDRLSEFPILDEVGTGFGVFWLAEEPRPVHEDHAIRDWWLKNVPADTNTEEGQCLLTGEIANLARLHPKIKGVGGAQSAGASLVSFNDSAYESYGKSQSYNSPVSETAAFKYGVALNTLLNGPKSDSHRIRIGDTTCVFWTDKKTVVESIFAAFSNGGDLAIDDAQDEGVRKNLEIFLKALRQGRKAAMDLDPDPDSTRFYLLGLAPNAARLSVRFFYESSLTDLIENLRKHFQDMEIVRDFEKPVGKRKADPVFPAYWQFLRETTRSGDDPPPLLGGALMRAILESTPYPESLYTTILRRVHMERSINYIRAAAIKAVLVRNHQQPITTMLDPKNENPAYLLGRLFAVLEKIQEEGHREQTGRTPEKTIRDTYFSAACATPLSVFSRLQQLSTHHRRHLNPGRKAQFDRLIGEINWPLSPDTPYPKSHNLTEQGLFLIGYYHQRKDLFTKKTAEPETESAAVTS
jgi:CRISPR-associated protein Csd1